MDANLENIRSIKPGCVGLPIEGDAIQVTVDKIDREYIESKIALFGCYKISHYIAQLADSYMKVVKHNALLRIGHASIIIPINDESIPTLHLDICSYEKLSERNDNHQLLTDYIGIIEDTKDCNKSSNNPYLRITLRNERNQHINVTIWKETLCTLDRQALENAKHTSVVAVTGTKVTTFSSLQLQSIASTCVYINPPVSMTSTLLESLKSQPPQITAASTLRETQETPTTLASLTQKKTRTLSTFSNDGTSPTFSNEHRYVGNHVVAQLPAISYLLPEQLFFF